METSLILRFILLASLFGLIAYFGYLLKNRNRFQKIVENRRINILMVGYYNFACFTIGGLLPSDSNISVQFISHPNSQMGSYILQNGIILLGYILAIYSIVLFIFTIHQRRVVGIENTKTGLIISGTYKNARHPIYLGIVLFALACGLIFQNWEGLLLWPGVLIANFCQGYIEENYDLIPRFGEEYRIYKKQVSMFGSFKVWGPIILSLGILLLLRLYL